MPKPFRRRTALSPGIPGGSSAPPPRVPEPGLQLAIGREGVGLEPTTPVTLGAVTLADARAHLLGVSFPLDVSGGLSRFRHRRTALSGASLTLSHGAIERWLAALAFDAIGRGSADARVGWRKSPDDGCTVLRVELSSGEALVAFDLEFADVDGMIHVLAHRLRGLSTELPLVPLVGAFLRRTAAAIGGTAHGLSLLLDDPLRAPIEEAFVLQGARLPSRDGVWLSALEPDVERTRVEFGHVPMAPSTRAAALMELAALAGDADARWVEGDVDAAREGYLRALDRAPRHPAILLRIAELDASVGDRVEAALSWLRETPRAKKAPPFGDDALGRAMLAGRLHARLGAITKARGALDRAGMRALDESEPHVAARCYALAASLLDDDDPALANLLDRALGADPTERSARWRRAWLRVRAGDDSRALEDVQHIEALTRDRGSRRAMLLRAGELWHRAGRLARAVSTYERALRYAPADRAVVGGLARALLASGAAPRAVELLAKSIELPAGEGAPKGTSPDDLLIDLARALADSIGDVPAAIARLRGISDDARRAPLAHALSAAFRTRIGDRVGARQSLARAADLVERRGVDAADAASVSTHLADGARAAEHREEAQRLALAALIATPADPDVAALVRALGADDSKIAARTEAPPAPTGSQPESVAGIESEGAVPDEREIDQLRARVQGDPTDDAAAERLASLLMRSGRDFEAFALLSARWDDATESQRTRIAPTQRQVLARLAELAEREGRAVEAQLFREALAALR